MYLNFYISSHSPTTSREIGLLIAPSCNLYYICESHFNINNKLQSGLILCYIDDIIVASQTFEDHLHHIEATFQRLRAANLKLKPSKCIFKGKSGTTAF